jgi:hypothetical protein
MIIFLQTQLIYFPDGSSINPSLHTHYFELMSSSRFDPSGHSRHFNGISIHLLHETSQGANQDKYFRYIYHNYHNR